MEPPREICESVEEWLVESEGRRYGYFYAALRSKDTGEYVFWMSKGRGFEGLGSIDRRYRGYKEMLEGVSRRFGVRWRHAG